MTAIHVICFGNYWQGDDGFGIHVCRRLREIRLPAGVKVFEAGTAGLGAIAFFEGCAKAVIVDAIKSGQRVGTIHRFRAAECDPPGEEYSTHAMGANHIVAALAATFEPELVPEVVVIGAEVGRITPFTDALTPPLQAALERAVRLVQAECMN